MENSLVPYMPVSTIGLTPADIYEYLRTHLLASYDNPEMMMSCVKEAYFDLIEELNDPAKPNAVNMYSQVLPTVSSIAARIDEDNQAIIDQCCHDAGLLDDDADRIQIMYSHDIACMLDDWVRDSLWTLGLWIDDRDSRSGSKLLLFGAPSRRPDPDQLKLSFGKEWDQCFGKRQ